jgi:hypothetical protein
MDSLLPTTTRSESLQPNPRTISTADDRLEDSGFGPELARQLRAERRTSRPPSASEPSPNDEPTPGRDEAGSTGEAEAGGDASRQSGTADDAEQAASRLAEPRTTLSAAAGASPWNPEPTGLPKAGLPTVALGAGAVPPGAGTEASGASEASPTKPVAFAAIERVTEEQLNVRKLTKYLVSQAADGASEKVRSDRADPAPRTLAPTDPQPGAPVGAQPQPKPELEHRRAGSTPTPKPDAAPEGAPPATKTVGPDGLELGRPFDPAARAQVTTAPEAEAAGREQQLRAATQRALAEARQRMLEPGRMRDGRLAVTLDVREATIPMRLRFSPDGHGGQNVAFLVSTAKDLRELKRLMPEIETVLTELPVEVSDVNVDVDSFRDRPTSRARGERR